MANTVLKSFLIDLGFKVDDASLKKFDNQIKEVEKTVKSFAIGFAALAVGVEESIRRVARNFEQLFFLSQQIGSSATNLKSLQFAFSQIGMSAQASGAAMMTLQKQFIESPGMKNYVANLVPGFVAATGTADEALDGLAKVYSDILKMPEGAAKAAREGTYLRTLEFLGLDGMAVRQAGMNHDRLQYWKAKALATLTQFGLDSKTAAKQSFEATQAWGFVGFQLQTAFERLTISVMPAVTAVLSHFSDWLAAHAPDLDAWAKRVEKWFDDPKNVENFNKTLDKALDAALALGRGIVWLIEQIAGLNDGIGATGTLLAVLIGFKLLKGAIGGIGGGLVRALFGPLLGAATGVGTSVGGAIVSAAAASIFAGWMLWKEGTGKKGSLTGADNPNRFYDPSMPFGGSGSTELPRQTGGDDPNRPGTYSGPPTGAMGGHDTLLEQMVMGLQHWWAGSGNFRPYVVLAESTYASLADMLRDVFGLVKPRESTGVPGDAGATAPGPGGAGPHGMPGPGGGSGSGGGGGGGDTSGVVFPEGWVPDPNAPQMATSKQEFTHPERNNPGNLRAGGGGAEGWVGQTTPAGSAFETFKTVEEGIRARAITYFSYITKRGADTIQKIAERSGPASDNNDIPSQVAAYRKAMGGKYAEKGGENLPIEATPENLRRLTAGGLSIEIGGRGEFLPKSAGMDVINKVFATMAKGGFGGGAGAGAGGGGGKPTTGMVPEFAANLKRAIDAANKATGEHLQLVSGWRSQEHQNRLKANDPSGMTARHSKHTEGVAGDLGSGGRLARQMTPGLRWLHEHADEFNLHFPLTGRGGMPYEPWHAEQRGSRGGARPGASASHTDNRTNNQHVVVNVHGDKNPGATGRVVAALIEKNREKIEGRNNGKVYVT